MIKEGKIQICHDCKGYGIFEEEIGGDYHKGEYVYENRKCETCNGSGRLFVESKVKPFKPPKIGEKKSNF